MKENMCFVAVEFVDDDNVRGYFYWYLCELSGVAEGVKVVAPLGRHNNLQEGIVRKIKFTDENNAPFPLHSIKYIRKIIKEEK